MLSLSTKHVLVLKAVAYISLLIYNWRYSTSLSITKTTLTAVLFEAISNFVWSTFVYPRYVSPLRHLPHDATSKHWLLGHGWKILEEPYCSPVREWALSVPNDGFVRYFGFFNVERLLLTSPAAIHDVLVNKTYIFPKPASLRETASRFLGRGLILSEGDIHSSQRQRIKPAFAPRHFKTFYPLFWRKTRQMVRMITAADCDNENDTGLVELRGWASRITLDLIGVAGLGKDFGALEDETNKLVETYYVLLKPSRQALFLSVLETFVPPWVLTKLPFKLNSEIGTAAGHIREVCREIIRAKKTRLAGGSLEDADILSLALKTGAFSDEELLDQAMTILAAGHDTTASSLVWAIYLLARHPNIQNKLRQEIQDRLPPLKTEADITSLDIDTMPYLNAVCSETLRYYSPVPQTLREAACDTTILGQPISKGTRVIIAPWATHRDPRFWGEDAGEFNPDRWLTADNEERDERNDETAEGKSRDIMNYTGSGSVNKNAFLTFLYGPRGCIGQGFARAEFACLLAGWVGSFEFDLHDKSLADEKNLDIRGGITAVPANGMHIVVRKVVDW